MSINIQNKVLHARNLEQILLENEYIRLALIEDFPESDKNYTWRVYCVNLSEKTVRVDLVDTVENGQQWYDWYIGDLEPGQQCFKTDGYYHNGKTNQEILTGDLVVREGGYNGQELSRDPVRLEFHW